MSSLETSGLLLGRRDSTLCSNHQLSWSAPGALDETAPSRTSTSPSVFRHNHHLSSVSSLPTNDPCCSCPPACPSDASPSTSLVGKSDRPNVGFLSSWSHRLLRHLGQFATFITRRSSDCFRKCFRILRRSRNDCVTQSLRLPSAGTLASCPFPVGRHRRLDSSRLWGAVHLCSSAACSASVLTPLRIFEPLRFERFRDRPDLALLRS